MRRVKVDYPESVCFVCTDKARHQKRYPRVQFLPTKVVFQCTGCERNLQLTHERLDAILAQLRAAEIEEVDISMTA